MRGSAIAVVVLGALLLVPAALAVVDGTYRGRSSQGFKVSAQVTDTQVQRLNIPWKATDCTPDDGYVVTLRRFVYTNDENGAIEQSGNRFSDSGRVTFRSKGRRVVVHSRVAGRMSGADRMSGTQRVSVRTDDTFGKHSCTARMKWSAKRLKPAG
jgi:hypothetical protein